MTVEPIKKQEDIDKMFLYLKQKNPRDAILFLIGISSGFRISDLVEFKAGDFKALLIKDVKERKTGNIRKLYINEDVLKNYIEPYIENYDDDEYLFQSRNGYNQHISVSQAYNIVKDAAKKTKIKVRVGTHTMRKTFGYRLYEQTNHNQALVCKCFGHSDPSITMRYIGLDEEAKKEAIENLTLGVTQNMNNFENPYRKKQNGK